MKYRPSTVVGIYETESDGAGQRVGSPDPLLAVYSGIILAFLEWRSFFFLLLARVQ